MLFKSVFNAIRRKIYQAKQGSGFSLALVLVVGLGLLRSDLLTSRDGLLSDEHWHAVAGVSYVQKGDYRLNPEHPPLAKLWVGLMMPEFKLPPFRVLADKADERTFVSEAFFLRNDWRGNQVRIRAAMLSFHGLALVALGFGLRRLFGSYLAVVTIALLVLDPTITAHLPVMMTDLPVALLSALALVRALIAFQTWSLTDLTWASLTCGLALSTKHSALTLALTIALIGQGFAIFDMATFRVASWLKIARRSASAVGVMLGAIVVLWGCYGFRFSESLECDSVTASSAYSRLHDDGTVFNRSLKQKIDDLKSPNAQRLLRIAGDAHLLPRAYLWGLADVMRVAFDGRQDTLCVFERRFYSSTPWYFFPIVLIVKLPLSFLLLTGVGGLLFASDRVSRSWRIPMLLLVLWDGIYLTTIMRGNSGYAGIRHALPVFPSMALLAGTAVTVGLMRREWIGVAVGGLLLTELICVTRVVRPWEYYNLLVGGADHAWHSFCDDGIDQWQRSRELATYYDAYVRGASALPYDFYGVESHDSAVYNLKWHRLEDDPPGEDIVSGTVFVNARFLSKRATYDYAAFRDAPIVARFGNLLVLRGTFHVPWLPALRLRSKLGEGDPEQRTRLLQEIVDIYPDDYQAAFELGNVLVERGEYESAVRAYDHAQERAPQEDAFITPLRRQIAALQRPGATDVPPLRNPWLE